MRYYHLTLAPRRGQPLPVCRIEEGYHALAQGTPADIPVYRVKDAILSAVKDRPGLTDVGIVEVPSDEIAPDLITARHEEAFDWECPTPARCRCGAVAIVRETVCWRSPEGPARRVYAWCTSCYPVEHREEEPTPRTPQHAMLGKLDGWTIVQDWQKEQQCHDDTGGTDC